MPAPAAVYVGVVVGVVATVAAAFAFKEVSTIAYNHLVTRGPLIVVSSLFTSPTLLQGLKHLPRAL